MIVTGLSINSFAQKNEKENDEKKGFKKENLFTGGSATLAFSNIYTAIGISPHFGYSLTNWADAGVVLNFNYQSQRDYFDYGDKLHQTTYGPGAFVRLFPIRFLFAQVQYEHNFITSKYFPVVQGAIPSQFNDDENSLLVGGGYAGGRAPGNNSFYYFAVLWDVLALPGSPYVDGLGRGIPIFKVGYNIALFQGKSGKYVKRRRRP